MNGGMISKAKLPHFQQLEAEPHESQYELSASCRGNAFSPRKAIMTTQSPVMNLYWDKLPSVTYGGKPYFFNTVTNNYLERRTVVWDRQEKAWAVKGPQTLEHYHGKIYGYFPTAQAARQFVAAGKA